jgi:hypothetical protein
VRDRLQTLAVGLDSTWASTDPFSEKCQEAGMFEAMAGNRKQV